MNRTGWLVIMFVGAIVVNGLILFTPPLICAQNQPVEEKGFSQQGEETGDMTKGRINSFDGEDTIVISDITFSFSNSTRFYNMYGAHIPVSRLKVNELVVFLSVDGRLEEVRQLNPKAIKDELQIPFQVGSGKEEEGAESEHNNGQRMPILIEDGVWRN